MGWMRKGDGERDGRNILFICSTQSSDSLSPLLLAHEFHQMPKRLRLHLLEDLLLSFLSISNICFRYEAGCDVRPRDTWDSKASCIVFFVFCRIIDLMVNQRGLYCLMGHL